MSKENKDNYVKPPTFMEMVKGFAKETKKFIEAGAPIISTEEYSIRLLECNKCEHLIRKSMRCGQCGCLLQAKARMKTAHCPLGKWENGIENKNPNGEK